jgi:hypothetical protein
LASLPASEERSKDSAKSQAESSNNKTDPLCAVKTGVNRVLRAKIAKHGCTNNKDKADYADREKADQIFMETNKEERDQLGLKGTTEIFDDMDSATRINLWGCMHRLSEGRRVVYAQARWM